MPPAEAGVAHAAHRRADRAVGRRVRLVDVDGAAVQAGRDGPATAVVLRPDAGVQAVRGGVGGGDGLLLGVEAVHRDHRAEGLLLADLHRGSDAVQDGRLEEQRPDLGAGLAAREDGGARLDGLLDVPGDGLQLLGGDQRAHPRAPRQAAAEPQCAGPGGEPGEELVGDRAVHVEPLDRYAELPGGGEAGPDGAFGGLVQVGVGQHQHGVLAAQLQRGADQAGGGLLGDLAAGPGRAGERDVVGVVDHGRADHRAVADHDLPEVGGQSGLDQQLAGPEGGQRGLRVGLVDHRVARDEGGQGVADGEFERVVPRRDLPDHTLRTPGLDRMGEHRQRPAVAAVAQVRGRRAPVVPGGQRDGEHLFEGVQAGLAGLGLDQVEHLVLPLEQQVVEAQQDGGPAADGQRGPAPLRPAGQLVRHLDVGRGGARQAREPVAGQRRGGVHQLGLAGRRDALGQPGDQRRRNSRSDGARGARCDRVAPGRLSICRDVRHEAQPRRSRATLVPAGNRKLSAADVY